MDLPIEFSKLEVPDAHVMAQPSRLCLIVPRQCAENIVGGESSGVGGPCSFALLFGLASGDLDAALRLVGDLEVTVFVRGL